MEIDPIEWTGPAVFVRQDDRTFHLPARIRAHITDEEEAPVDVDLSVSVDGDGSPRCEELSLRRRPEGVYITPGTLRALGLVGFMREAVRLASTPVEVVEQEDRTIITIERAAAPGAPFARRARPARRNEPRREDMRRAATLYAEAKSAGRPQALEWVAEQMGLSRSTAYNWVRRGQQLED